MQQTREALQAHINRYPRMQITDIFKYIHQSSFGCEHLIASPEAAAEYIRTEYERGDFPTDAPLAEPLDGAYSRVHLACLGHGLRAETLAKLFFFSAQTEPNGKADAESKLQIAKTLASEGHLPCTAEEFEIAAFKWQASGFPAVHHSDEFRQAYRPAYRVIANEYVPFLPLLAKLDSANDINILAIEGGSASGKSTLGALLQQLYDCTVLHMDDFFLRPEQRTPARYAEVGGNIDYERFAKEILLPLKSGKPIRYRKFDCATMSLAEPITITPKKLVVIEGVYSMHPYFEKYYDFSAFLNISSALQAERIAMRNPPALAKRFHEEWIPLENLYFSKMQIQDRCNMTISIKKQPNRFSKRILTQKDNPQK